MASIKYAGIITELKGSIGGVTFQRCGNALSVRSNPSHKKAFTIQGQSSRNLFASCVSAWRGLTLSEKAAWSAAASSYPTVDKWGNPTILNGFQIFMYVNRFLLTGFPIPVFHAYPYTPHALMTAVLSDFNVTDSTCALSWISGAGAARWIYIFISNPYDANVYKPYAPLFFAGSVHADVGFGYDVFALINASFRFAPVAGQSFTFTLYSVDSTTGQAMFEQKNYCSIIS
jgi:hypothetical protein